MYRPSRPYQSVYIVLSIHSFESDKSPYQQFTTSYAKELQKHTHKITNERIKKNSTYAKQKPLNDPTTVDWTAMRCLNKIFELWTLAILWAVDSENWRGIPDILSILAGSKKKKLFDTFIVTWSKVIKHTSREMFGECYMTTLKSNAKDTRSPTVYWPVAGSWSLSSWVSVTAGWRRYSCSDLTAWTPTIGLRPNCRLSRTQILMGGA